VATFSGNQVIWQDGVFVWTTTNNPPLLITVTDANNVISHVKLLTPQTSSGSMEHSREFRGAAERQDLLVERQHLDQLRFQRPECILRDGDWLPVIDIDVATSCQLVVLSSLENWQLAATVWTILRIGTDSRESVGGFLRNPRPFFPDII